MASANYEIGEERLQIALSLPEHGGQLYAQLDDAGRQQLNQAFGEIFIGQDGVTDVVLNQPFRWLAEQGLVITMGDQADASSVEPEQKASTALVRRSDDELPGVENYEALARQTGPALLLRASRTKRCTRPNLDHDRGSNLSILAEGVGFEPTEACTSHAFQACRFGRSRIPPEKDPA